MFFNAGFVTILYFHFVKSDISFFSLLLAEAIGTLAVVLFIALGKSIRTRRNIFLGYALILLALALLFLPYSQIVLLFPYVILRGLGGIIFYVPYNILFFQKVQKDRNLREMTKYLAVALISGVIAPIVGGWLFSVTALPVFLLIAASLIFISVYFTKFLPKEVYTYSCTEIWGHIKGLRTLVTMDGALHKVFKVVIPLYSIQYFAKATDFGLFLSVITLVAVAISFYVARVSDGLQKRKIFIIPLSIAASIISFSFYFITSFQGFFITAIFLQLVTVLVDPIRGNIVQDTFEQTPALWISRELFLNIGRALFYIVTAILLYFGLFEMTFIFFALLHLSFPIFLLVKKVYVPAH